MFLLNCSFDVVNIRHLMPTDLPQKPKSYIHFTISSLTILCLYQDVNNAFGKGLDVWRPLTTTPLTGDSWTTNENKYTCYQQQLEGESKWQRHAANWIKNTGLFPTLEVIWRHKHLGVPYLCLNKKHFKTCLIYFTNWILLCESQRRHTFNILRW